MSLDLSKLGYQTRIHEFNYDWKTVILYALGVGAKQDELGYLYEGFGPKVYPTFAVVPAYGPVNELLAASGADLHRIVHSGQSIRVHRPIPASGCLRTVGTIEGIYDLKRMALVVLRTVSETESGPLFETRWSILYRGLGRFGGPPPPKSQPAAVPDGAQPAFTHEEPISAEQALLYRLSGDHNPLHADPRFAAEAGFERGPILHGLCTYGLLARAAIRHACDGDGDRLKVFEGQFKRPVWPGQTLQTRGYEIENGRLALRAYATDDPNLPVASGWAELARG